MFTPSVALLHRAPFQGLKMSSEIQWVWHQGQLVQWSAARAHVTTHALHYGTAIFEGIRAHGSPRGPQFFRLGDHLRRFAESARLHRMQLPCSMEQVRQACHAVITANRLEADRKSVV